MMRYRCPTALTLKKPASSPCRGFPFRNGSCRRECFLEKRTLYPFVPDSLQHGKRNLGPDDLEILHALQTQFGRDVFRAYHPSFPGIVDAAPDGRAQFPVRQHAHGFKHRLIVFPGQHGQTGLPPLVSATGSPSPALSLPGRVSRSLPASFMLMVSMSVSPYSIQVRPPPVVKTPACRVHGEEKCYRAE